MADEIETMAELIDLAELRQVVVHELVANRNTTTDLHAPPTATAASIWSRPDSPRSTADRSSSTTPPAVRPSLRCKQRCRAMDVDELRALARADSPGWSTLVLADFVDAFDEQALGTYRRAVVALDRKLEDRDQWGRFEVDIMLLELADHDGDVDRALTCSAGVTTRSTGRSSTGCAQPDGPRKR